MKHTALISCILVLLHTCISFADGATSQTNTNYTNIIDSTHHYETPVEGLQVLNAFFSKDESYIYVIDNFGEKWIRLVEADYDSFEVISGRFAKDKDHFFQTYTIMHGVDPESFVVVSAEHGYAGDDLNIYGPKGRITGADPDTFRMLNKNYAQDIAHVYYQGQRIIGVDAGSVQVLGENHIADANFVFYKNTHIEGAEPKGFEVTGLYTGVDADGVQYFENSTVNETPDPDVITDPSELENGKDEPLQPTTPDNGDQNPSEPDEPDTPVIDTDPDSPDTEKEPLSENASWAEKALYTLTGKNRDLSTIHFGYLIFLPLVFFAGLACLYQLFARRFDKDISLIMACLLVIISVVLASILALTLWKFTSITSPYAIIALFFSFFFVALWLIGIIPLSSFIKNLGISATTSVIGAILSSIVVLMLERYVDLSALVETTSNPLVFTNLTLTLASTFLLSILYKSTTTKNWTVSIIRVIIATIVAIALTILSQQLFDYTSILLTVAIYHVFLLIVLMLIGMRSTNHKLLHFIHVARSVFLHFVIMFIIFLIVRGFLIV